MNEHEIRVDERRKLAALLEEHAELLGEFAADTVAAVRLVALMIRLDQPPALDV
jgi:hypothetical protein